ncbi:MAG TPA: ATP-binding protein [Paucimonas sp.]|nr:ATP-binding protein [Paucimonas sp.]
MGRLFWKFFWFTLVAQLIAAAGVGTAVWYKHHAEQRGAVLDMGPPAAFSAEAAAIALQYGGEQALLRLLERSDPRHPFYAVRDDGRELLGRGMDLQLVQEARRLAEEGRRRDVVRDVTAGGHRYLLFSVREVRPRGAGLPEPPRRERPPPRGVFPAFVPVISALFGSLIFALGIAWYFSKPIRNLRSAFDAAAAGDLDLRIGTRMGNRRDELTDLGRDFDRMANQLRALVDGQRKLLHDVSHELRSPLARMQAAIGLARQDPRKIEAALERVERESARMDMLVDELLTLSRLEAGVMSVADECIAIDDLMIDVIEDAQFEAEAGKCRIGFDTRSGAVVRGSPDWLRRVIENVVRNAVKYGGADGEIEIAASGDARCGKLRIEVLDRGPGVPEAELDAIFEPFFRGSHSEHRQDGHGLGLAIAKRIVEVHGGTIRASNRAGGGLRVEIVLPLA